MIKVILDTNFLVYCAKNKIDFSSGIDRIMKEGYELVVPSLVFKELKELGEKEKKLSDRESAKLALKLLNAEKIKIVDFRGKNADEVIIDISAGNIVATLDRDIRKKVERSIILREENKIEFG